MLDADNSAKPHAELDAERTYVAGLYDRLEELREQKRGQLASVRHTSGGFTPQGMSERDAFATMYEDRLAQLDAVDDHLVFGRLDLDSGHKRYIGRIGLSTEELVQLMVDWRAPEASTFYQATAFNRQGVRRRRHLILQGHTVVSIEDDVLDAEHLNAQEHQDLQGEGALLAALNSKRTGQMGDIVATIQAEQDRVVRAPLPGALVVQGGPGTGKTAVALHRAAYLLYTYRQRLGNAGVLVVGPSSTFMTYIERVLPSLGETGVVMSSIGRLMPGTVPTLTEPDDVTEVKGRLVMAEVIARAVANRQRIPAEPKQLRVESRTVTLTPKQVRKARDKARATGKPYNEARGTFVKILLRQLTDQLTQQIREANPSSGADLSYVAEEVRAARDVRVAINLAWMPMTPQKLVGELFAREALLEAAAPELTTAERALLVRETDTGWSEADVPLLDEAAELLGELESSAGADAERERQRKRDLDNARRALENMHESLASMGVDGVVEAEEIADFYAESQQYISAAERAAQDRDWAYGHIVVDEAQELSPMQWRLLTRRCPVKSFTIVGDIAQTSSAAGARSWASALEPHFGERFTVEELTVNYRTPAQISDAAVRMARAAGTEISAPVAVREGQWPVEVVRTETALSRIAEIVEGEFRAIAGGLVAVIASARRVPALAATLRSQFGNRVGNGSGSLSQDIVVLSAKDAKGLEFDSVIIVEPAELTTPQGVGDLYVAMTRPTQRLSLVVETTVPAGIED